MGRREIRSSAIEGLEYYNQEEKFLKDNLKLLYIKALAFGSSF